MAAKKRQAKRESREMSAEVRRLLEEGYETVSGGAGEPWDAGLVIAGEFKGVHDSNFQQDDGEYAKLVDVETGSGLRTFRCPTVLANRLERVSVGDSIRVECFGKIKTNAGRTAWDFGVLVKRNSPAPANVAKPAKAKPTKRGRK